MNFLRKPIFALFAGIVGFGGFIVHEIVKQVKEPMTITQALQIFTSGQGTYQDFSDARAAMVTAYAGTRASIPVPAPPNPPLTPDQIFVLPQFSTAFANLGGPAPCQGPVIGVPAGEACVNKLLAVEAARNAFHSDQNARFNFLTCIRSWALNVNATGDITWPYHCDAYVAGGAAVNNPGEGGALSAQTPIKTSGIATYIPPASTPAIPQTGSAPVSATSHPPQATAGPAAQPNKIGGTVEPGSIPTAQRDGTGTVPAGSKTISVLGAGQGTPASDQTSTTTGTPGTGAGYSSSGSAAVSDLFSGMGSWLHDPQKTAGQVGLAFNSLTDTRMRWYALGILALPVLVGWVAIRATRHEAIVPHVGV